MLAVVNADKGKTKIREYRRAWNVDALTLEESGLSESATMTGLSQLAGAPPCAAKERVKVLRDYFEKAMNDSEMTA